MPGQCATIVLILRSEKRQDFSGIHSPDAVAAQQGLTQLGQLLLYLWQPVAGVVYRFLFSGETFHDFGFSVGAKCWVETNDVYAITHSITSKRAVGFINIATLLLPKNFWWHQVETAFAGSPRVPSCKFSQDITALRCL